VPVDKQAWFDLRSLVHAAAFDGALALAKGIPARLAAELQIERAKEALGRARDALKDQEGEIFPGFKKPRRR
jgi:hypothetical protein